MFGKKVKVKVNRPLGTYHPINKDLYYPINYGYIEGIVIAVIHRKNDVEEKWVVAPEGMIFTKEEVEEAIHFQEKYFDYEIKMT